MKRILIAITVTMTLTGSILGEQTNRVEFVWDEARFRDRASIAALVRRADVAGVGEFVSQPSPANPYAYVTVNDYWTGNPGTNVVKILAGDAHSTDWMFPTNTPVVFFALTHMSILTRWKVRGYTNGLSQAELDELIFPNGDDAWFRTTRDNGLLYAFATNLWECQRVNPNQERFYEILRDADNLPYASSSRIFEDTGRELSFLFKDVTDAFLLEKNADPLIGNRTKGSIFQEFLSRGWTRTNGVYFPPQDR